MPLAILIVFELCCWGWRGAWNFGSLGRRLGFFRREKIKIFNLRVEFKIGGTPCQLK